MLRRFLAVYLVLVTAAGPCLCCCSLTRLFARRPAAQSVIEVPPCCRTPDEGGRDQGHDGCPCEHGDPEKRGCPCKASASSSLVARAAETTDHLVTAHVFPLPFLHVAFVGRPAVGCAPALPGGPPTRTAEDMLRLHHQLRC